MKILISILIAIILAFLTSKFKISIQYQNKCKNFSKIEFDVNLSLYLFGLIKIYGISLKEDGIHFLIFKIPYNTIKIKKDSVKILDALDLLKLINLKLDKFYFDLKVGCEDMMFTVFLVFAISTFLSIASAKNSKQINLKNYYYKITPIYNTNTISFNFFSVISIKTYYIIKTLIFGKKHTKNKKEYNINIRRAPIKI